VQKIHLFCDYFCIVPIYAKVSFDTTKNKPALGLVAKIDGKAIGFSYATIGEYFIGNTVQFRK
jgi:hypothetical protein